MIQARTHSRHLSRHMILVACALALVAIAMASVGCGKKDDNSGRDGVIAVTPLASCASGATYRGNNWGQTAYGQMNAYPYGYGQQNYQSNPQSISSQGFCGCPAGTQAMCDGTYGVVCVQGSQLQQVPNIAWYGPGQNGYGLQGYGSYSHYSGGQPVAYGPQYGAQYGPQVNQWEPGYGPGPGYDGGQPPRRHRYHGQSYPQPVPQAANPVDAQCATQIGQTCVVGTNSCGPSADCRRIPQNQMNPSDREIGICAR